MAVITGLEGSFRHVENGMIEEDMRATLEVARDLDEAIVFRSTGPWSKRWIKDRFPTKNFHVKGKSSDWGPQAGFVPELGKYSKVGHDDEAAAKGTKANKHGTQEGFTRPKQLMLILKQIDTQLTQPEETPARRALTEKITSPANDKDYLLKAERSGDRKVFWFLAKFTPDGKYAISVFDETRTLGASHADIAALPSVPLNVMVSLESGANEQPMTGDYDLMMVCPSWRDYQSVSTEVISKSALDFGGNVHHALSGASFKAGSRMDTVLDMRLSTGAIVNKKFLGLDDQGRQKWAKYTHQKLTANMDNELVKWDGSKVLSSTGQAQKIEEHLDMGNLTPRILRCINRLNAAMVLGGGAMRRVHHNAESHRHEMFGALVAKDMVDKDDGFPMTGFHPRSLENAPGWAYGDVVTIEKMDEFAAYMDAMNRAGYQVPKNAAWKQSIRDRKHA